MKITALQWPALASIALAGWLTLPAPSHGQADDDATAMNRLIADLTVQQATVADNQTKIDEKLVTIAEEVRQARIFAARGGGKTK